MKMTESAAISEEVCKPVSKTGSRIDKNDLTILRELEQKVMWLSSWMIHEANYSRPERDGLKVGGHQASCASVATLMTALYFQWAQGNNFGVIKTMDGAIGSRRRKR